MTENSAKNKTAHNYLYLLFIFGLLIIGVFVNKNKQVTTPSKNTDQQSVDEGKMEDPNNKTYLSSKLKIKFSYLENQDNDFKVQAKETGDKVYVYVSPGQPEQGQYIEVFTKNKNQSLEEAIKAKFLSNHSPSDCFVKLNPTYPDSTPVNKNFNYAEISFPTNSDPDSQGPWWTNAEKCPKNYTTTNGISYFIEDRNHPDRFAYISIGQYVISASKNLGWQDTIEFID